MKNKNLMDKETVSKIKFDIEHFPVRLIKSGYGYLRQSGKQIQNCETFLFFVNDYAIEYLYFEYENTPVYRQLTDKFIICDADRVSGNWLHDHTLLYDAKIGEWSNLNHTDKNVYKLATSAIIKYANYVHDSYQKISQYIKDDESDKASFPYEYRKQTAPKFKDKMAFNPAFLSNLRTQLNMLR